MHELRGGFVGVEAYWLRPVRTRESGAFVATAADQCDFDNSAPVFICCIKYSGSGGISLVKPFFGTH